MMIGTNIIALEITTIASTKAVRKPLFNEYHTKTIKTFGKVALKKSKKKKNFYA